MSCCTLFVALCSVPQAVIIFFSLFPIYRAKPAATSLHYGYDLKSRPNCTNWVQTFRKTQEYSCLLASLFWPFSLFRWKMPHWKQEWKNFGFKVSQSFFLTFFYRFIDSNYFFQFELHILNIWKPPGKSNLF